MVYKQTSAVLSLFGKEGVREIWKESGFITKIPLSLPLQRKITAW